MSTTFSDISAILVTRGDVPEDVARIAESLPYDEVIIWDNSKSPLDYGVYGRYAAIPRARNQIIYVQDDDCIVTCHEQLLAAYRDDHVIANQATRHEEYPDYALLGWGALFHRALPERAFRAWDRYSGSNRSEPIFKNTVCDMLVSMINPHIKVPGGHENLPAAWAPHHVSCTPEWAQQKVEAEKLARYVTSRSLAASS